MKMSLEKIASKGQQPVLRVLYSSERTEAEREEQSLYRAAWKHANLEHRGRDTRESRLYGWSDHTSTSLCNEYASQNTRIDAHIADIDTDSREQASERVSECVATSAR